MTMKRWKHLWIVIWLLSQASAALAAPSFQSAPPDIRFGAVEAYASPDRAAELRVGWDRKVIHWYERQPENADQWNIPADEAEQVNRAVAAGRELVFLLMGTPAWATDDVPAGGVPRGLYLPVDDANNVWAAFVRRIVTEYAGRVNHWIIWNEPDIAPDEAGAQFEGTVQDYYQLLKVAYVVAKQANPQAVIHLAGMTHWHDVVFGRPPYLQRLFDEMRKDPTARKNNHYFDVATFHIYFRTETVFDLLNFYRQMMSRYGLRKAIWLNETNAAPADDPQHPWLNPMFNLTMEQQAGFVIQSHALALAAGAERVAVYKFNDIAPPLPGADSYGLFRTDGSARPAADAFRVVTTHFAGVRRTTYLKLTTYYVVRLERGGLVTRVLWARTGRSATVRLRPTTGVTSVAVYDQLGQAVPFTPDLYGFYTLTLPAARCGDPKAGCVVGGAPLVVVETLKPK